MTDSKVQRLLFERIEEWRFAKVEEVEQGHSQDAYRLSLSGRRALFKFDDDSRSRFVIPRRREASIQQLAAARGLSTGVYYVDDSCLLTEYVDAHVLREADFHDEEVLTRLGERLREVHSMPLTGTRFDGVAAAEEYAARISDSATAARCLSAVHALPRLTDRLVFSHNDLAVGNVLRTDDLLFIDWEYACDNSPLFDLATVIAHHGLTQDEADVLLDAYFGLTNTDDLAELALYERAYHALHWLWLAARDPHDVRLTSIAAEISN